MKKLNRKAIIEGVEVENMKSKTIIIIGFITSLIISCAFSLVYKFDNEIVKKVDMTCVKEDIPSEYKYCLDLVNIDNGILQVKGWIAKTGENLEYLNREVVLIDKNNTVYKINSIMESRSEVTKAFNDGFNYDKSGLHAQCPIKQFKAGDMFKIGYIVKEANGDEYYVLFNHTITV